MLLLTEALRDSFFSANCSPCQCRIRMCISTPPCRCTSLSPTINDMPVAALEAPPIPDSPPEKTGFRTLYILLLVCGFIMRFGFVLLKKTYIRSPGSILPFGAEVCSIAEHIVLGKGFSSPFYQDTGPTALIAPVYPYVCASLPPLRHLFRCVRDCAARNSMHHRRRHRRYHPCPGPPHRGRASRILGRVDLGAQPYLFPLAGILDLGLYRQRLSSFSGFHRRPGCCGAEHSQTLVVAGRALGADCAHQSCVAQRHAVYFSLRRFRELPLLPALVRFCGAGRSAFRRVGFALANPQRTRFRPAGFFSQQLLV